MIIFVKTKQSCKFSMVQKMWRGGTKKCRGGATATATFVEQMVRCRKNKQQISARRCGVNEQNGRAPGTA